MKYFKSLNCTVLLILTFLFISSCDDNNDPEPLFEDVPSVRVSKKIKEVRDLLIAADNGWKITYFTDDTQLGGFTFLFDFLNESEVVMDSDFGNPDPARVSLYDFSLGSTVKLSFTTANVIHQLSDGNIPPDNGLLGEGYKGSFEFLFSSFDGDDIIFRSNRDTSNYIRFKRATSEDWTDIRKHSIIRGAIRGQLAYEINGKANFFEYNIGRRFASNIDSQFDDTNFGVGFSSTGIIVSPSIMAENGTSYDKFILNDAKNKFISEDGVLSITILVAPYNVNQNWSITGNTPGDNSDAFEAIFKQISEASIAARNWPLSRTIDFGNTFTDQGTGISFFSISSPGRGFYGTFNLTFGGVLGNSNQINVVRSGPGVNWSFFTYFDPMVALIIDNAPYEVTATPVVDPTVIKLTSASNPKVFFTIKR